MEIRPVGEAERAAILRVYERCEDFLALGPQQKASTAMVLEDLRHSRGEGGVFCGIFAGGEMAGVVDFVPDDFEGRRGVAFLSLLMISREHRAKGLGRRVVEAVEAEIRKDGNIREIRSGVQVNNPGAIAFWKSIGYGIVSGPKPMPDQTTVFDLLKEIRPAII